MSVDQTEKTLKCIRCGFCLDACPTFRLTGNEADSPRGRIYLMRSVQEGSLALDEGVGRHLDSCLGCRACETACPSGVEYGFILEDFRAQLVESGSRPALNEFARRQLLDTLSNPARMAASLKAAGLLSRFTGPMEKMPSPIASFLSGSSQTPITLPSVPGNVTIGRLPELSRAATKKRYTVGILAGCVMRVLFHSTNLATVRVLQRSGCDVIAPREAGCCGAFHLHSGYPAEAKVRARALLDAFNSVRMDAFIVNSAGCGSTLKEYDELLADDPVYAKQARKFAAKVKDVSEWLVEIGIEPPERRFEQTVAYHDACHLAHGQGIRSAPRELLRSIPGLQLVDLPESDTCCGSAGIYNLTQPEMAGKLQARKVDFIVETGARVVATGNPGCLAWIEQGLRSRGIDMKVQHPVDILDAAYDAS